MKFNENGFHILPFTIYSILSTYRSIWYDMNIDKISWIFCNWMHLWQFSCFLDIRVPLAGTLRLVSIFLRWKVWCLWGTTHWFFSRSEELLEKFLEMFLSFGWKFFKKVSHCFSKLFCIHPTRWGPPSQQILPSCLGKALLTCIRRSEIEQSVKEKLNRPKNKVGGQKLSLHPWGSQPEICWTGLMIKLDLQQAWDE